MLNKRYKNLNITLEKVYYRDKIHAAIKKINNCLNRAIPLEKKLFKEKIYRLNYMKIKKIKKIFDIILLKKLIAQAKKE